jgi:alginate O-acetyltransferase complex protein AlgI
MSTAIESSAQPDRLKAAAWLPLLMVPAAVMGLAPTMPPWLFMWALAGAIYGGLKWRTWADREDAGGGSRWRAMGYLLCWPGMDAAPFVELRRGVERPRIVEWLAAFLKCVLGIGLIAGLMPIAITVHPLLAGWIGMVGLVLVLHFGGFHLLSNAWRLASVDARPIMNAPLLATSLADFWGRRWNLAFRDVAHAYVFRPLVRPCGAALAMLAVFLASGIVHDLVITLPAGGGYGGPTLYFLIQGGCLLAERSRFGKRLGLGRGIVGRVFCGAVVLMPLPLLFPPVFVERIALPFFAALGVL